MPAQLTPLDKSTPLAVAGRLHGALDMVRADRIGGWAVDRAKRGAAVEVDIFREGHRIATLRADRPRKDLARGDEEAGNHGFALALDPPLEPGFEFTIVAVARAGEVSAELQARRRGRAGDAGAADPRADLRGGGADRPAAAGRCRPGRGAAALGSGAGAHRGGARRRSRRRRPRRRAGSGRSRSRRWPSARGRSSSGSSRCCGPEGRDGPRAAHPLHPRQLSGAVRRAGPMARRAGLGGELRDGGAGGRPGTDAHPPLRAAPRALARDPPLRPGDGPGGDQGAGLRTLGAGGTARRLPAGRHRGAFRLGGRDVREGRVPGGGVRRLLRVVVPVPGGGRGLPGGA